METRNHRGWGHGLRPGTTSDLNCVACKREDAAKQPGPYEACLEWALDNGVNMEDFDRDIEDRGPWMVLVDIREHRYIGPSVDPDTGEAR